MRDLLKPGSLGRRIFFALIVGELIFAAVMGLTIGVFTALSDVQQRETAIRQISATIAAGLMPMIADQQITHVEAQLSSILESVEAHDVVGICIEDASGKEIACRGADDGSAVTPTGRLSPLAVLLEEQSVVEPVVVDGLRVATVTVRFAPAGLGPLRVPAIAAALVLFSVIIISLPWTAWKLSAEITEPLGELRVYATRLAEGELDAPSPHHRSGEVGELQDTLTMMARQLQDRDDRLRGSLAELETAYRSLAKAKDAIEELSAVKSNFVAVAAHEIRGPLTTIKLYTELLDEGAMGALSDKSQEAVAAITSATSRLTSIVSDLMDSALLERGLLPISLSEVHLRELVEEAVKDSQLVARKHGINLLVDGDVPDTDLMADGLRLRQVLDNLLSNAFKYSPQDSTVTVRVRVEEPWVRISVADEGRGIPEHGHRQLFALFGRVDFGDSRDTAGLGLGLAISSRIIEAHGGNIRYRANESGRGSVFVVELPLHAEQGRPTETTIRVSESESG